MKFSIIIPCNLQPRRNAAKDRVSKLARALQSAMLQHYDDFDIVIISDGCELTNKLVTDWFKPELKEGKIKLIQIEKQPDFSGNVRNAGIEASDADWICYLDADDILLGDHVSSIATQIDGQDWVYFNDLTLIKQEFVERECTLKLGFCGTANIAHKRELSSRWNPFNKYGYDDWNFIQNLKSESNNYKKILTPGYIVCHIPFKRGYDV